MVINKNLIVLNLNANRKEEVIKELAELAYNFGKINSVDKYVKTVLEREKLLQLELEMELQYHTVRQMLLMKQ
ncbi:PTS sugar transporter subunit IIA [Caloramator sp. mosi_1]|nr:PTS sugar transporter subunit IIA [Caloramator sp. mosi_1]WDC84773.1 PTS sugar transporter subunit IIA [Caloramator sp. mosi_1]